MEDQRFGAAIRGVRLRRGLRQADLASLAGASQATVSRIERGHLGSSSVDLVRAVARTLDIRVELLARWRAGDLDRLLNARHSALHESVARFFRGLPAWTVRPEVSFSIYGERGVIDLLGWHQVSGAIVVIELKTELADLNELVGIVDRKRRLAARIGGDLGWRSETTSAWVIVEQGRASRRRIAAHSAFLRGAFPSDGRSIRGWLSRPSGAMSALSMWPAVRSRRGRARARHAS